MIVAVGVVIVAVVIVDIAIVAAADVVACAEAARLLVELQLLLLLRRQL